MAVHALSAEFWDRSLAKKIHVSASNANVIALLNLAPKLLARLSARPSLGYISGKLITTICPFGEILKDDWGAHC